MEDMVNSSYDIKSAISELTSKEVAGITEIATKTAIATKSTREMMTEVFTQGHSIFKKTAEFSEASNQEFFQDFSNAISSTVQLFRTDGSDLAQGLSTLGASASAMGVKLSEQLAILGTSKQTFNSASEGATAYKAFVDKVGVAQQTLGLKFTDIQGKNVTYLSDFSKNKRQV